jgi:YcaO-like protein with predicted kinase domain
MPAMGITRVANVTGLDYLGIPVVTVCRPNSRSVAVSQGKGLNLAAAMASGIMESVESFHAEHIVAPLRFASYLELDDAAEATIDLAKLLRATEQPLSLEQRLFWIEGNNLIDGRTVWVPLEAVHTNYTLPALPGSGCFFASSNGLASGNHYFEAVCHAISETVERDCLAIWRDLDQETRDSRKIDLSTVSDEDCCSIIARCISVGMAIAVWEITSDIGVPAFCCWLADGKDTEFVVPGIGSGCHPCPAIAMLRALTEAVQMRLTLVSGSRDDLTWEDYKMARSKDGGHRFRSKIESIDGRRDFPSFTDYSSDCLRQDTDWQIERLRASGLSEVIVVDLSHRGTFDIPVVRVIIPGLECEDGYQPCPRDGGAIARQQIAPL